MSEEFWPDINMVGWCMMLGKVVRQVRFARLPVDFKLSLCFAALQPMNSHVHWFQLLWLDSIIYDRFHRRVVCLDGMGVRGWGWPILVSICLMNTASFAFKNNAPNSASAANDMTALIIVNVVKIAPLFRAELLLFDRKKCPPAWLCALFLFAYPVSLWTWRIISLALYDFIASFCVAR